MKIDKIRVEYIQIKKPMIRLNIPYNSWEFFERVIGSSVSINVII